ELRGVELVAAAPGDDPVRPDERGAVAGDAVGIGEAGRVDRVRAHWEVRWRAGGEEDEVAAEQIERRAVRAERDVRRARAGLSVELGRREVIDAIGDAA